MLADQVMHSGVSPALLKCVWGAGVSCSCIRHLLATKYRHNKPGTVRSQRKRPLPAQRLCDNKLRILIINIRGLRSNLGELTNLCKEKEPCIVILVDTFLDSSVEDGADCIAIPGYFMCCRKDRTLTSGGGIALYCLEGIAIHHNPLRDPEDLELMWLSVTLQSQKLLIGSLYRPPSANNAIID